MKENKEKEKFHKAEAIKSESGLQLRTGRLDFLDAAKAIALFTVIVGHYVSNDTPTFRFIFAFHMMFFFFATGYTFRIREGEDLVSFIKRKAKALLIPYAVFSVIGMLIMLVFDSWKTGRSFLWHVEKYLYYTQPPALGQVWFLACTFVSLIMVYPVVRLLEGKNGKVTCLKVLAAAACFALAGYYLIPKIQVPYFVRLPWKIDSGVMAVSFLMLGFLAGKTKVLKKVPVWLRIIGLAALPPLIYIIGVKKNGYVNICDICYSDFRLFYAGALAGILWMLDLGWAAQKSKALCLLGRNTLPIFCIHSFVLWAWLRVWCKFVIHQDLTHLPEGWPVYLLSVLTYVCCIPMALIWNYAWECINKRKTGKHT